MVAVYLDTGVKIDQSSKVQIPLEQVVESRK